MLLEVKKNLNRAGDKLEEIWDKFLNNNYSTFFDIAGAPGSWSQFLITKGMSGYGISIESKVKNLQWYPQVIKNLKFKKITGIKGNGDLYDPENVKSIDISVDLRVCDGGLGEDKMKELHCFRLFLGEAILSFKSLTDGGGFVIKMYDTFTELTCSFLYLLSVCFEKFYIIKPTKSRQVNGEKYCVGTNFTFNQEVYDILVSVYENFDPDNIPWELVKVPEYFKDRLRRFSVETVDKQLHAFREILKHY